MKLQPKYNCSWSHSDNKCRIDLQASMWEMSIWIYGSFWGKRKKIKIQKWEQRKSIGRKYFSSYKRERVKWHHHTQKWSTYVVYTTILTTLSKMIRCCFDQSSFDQIEWRFWCPSAQGLKIIKTSECQCRRSSPKASGF